MFTSPQPMPTLDTVAPLKKGSRKTSRPSSNSEGSSTTSFTSSGTPPVDIRSSRKKKKSSPLPRILDEEKPGVGLSFSDRSEVLRKVVADAAQKASEDNVQVQILVNVMGLVQDLVASHNELSRRAVEQESAILLLQQDRQVMVDAFKSMLNARLADVNQKQTQLQEFYLSQLPPNRAEFDGYLQNLKELIPELEGIRKWHQALSDKLLSGYQASNPASTFNLPGQLTSPQPPATLQTFKSTMPLQPYVQPLPLPTNATRQYYPLSFSSTIMPLPATGTTANPLLNAGSYAPLYAPYDNFTLPPTLYSSTTTSTLPFFSQKPPGSLLATTISSQSCPSSSSISSSSTTRNPHL